MTLRIRRIIYFAFIIVFLISAPIIAFYATGYRYNFKKNKVQKTGIFLIKSRPTDAEVYLNGRLQQRRTPATISNLIPDDYFLEIKRDGFHSWQKNLPIKSQLTTFAEDIFLFEKNLPKNLVTGKIKTIIPAPDQQKIIYLEEKTDSNEIRLMNLRTSEQTILYKLTAKGKDEPKIEWGADSQKVILAFPTTPAKYIILNTANDTADVYTELNAFYLNFKGASAKFPEPENLENLSFLDGPSQFITTINKKDQRLSVVENSSGNIIWQEKVDLASWSPDGKKILYLKNSEFWWYDFKKHEAFLLLPADKKIKDARWVNNNYVVVKIDNTIRAIELDERDKRNMADLVIAEELDNIDVARDEQKIYFTGKISKQQGIFELQY